VRQLWTLLAHINPVSTAVYLNITSELFSADNQRFDAFAPTLEGVAP